MPASMHRRYQQNYRYLCPRDNYRHCRTKGQPTIHTSNNQRSRPRQRASSRVSGLKRDLPADNHPNNVQQVKNVKYNESRRRRGTTAAKRGNAADHIQAIEHHFEEEPHVCTMCHPRTSTNTCHNYVHRRTKTSDDFVVVHRSVKRQCWV